MKTIDDIISELRENCKNNPEMNKLFSEFDRLNIEYSNISDLLISNQTENNEQLLELKEKIKSEFQSVLNQMYLGANDIINRNMQTENYGMNVFSKYSQDDPAAMLAMIITLLKRNYEKQQKKGDFSLEKIIIHDNENEPYNVYLFVNEFNRNILKNKKIENESNLPENHYNYSEISHIIHESCYIKENEVIKEGKFQMGEIIYSPEIIKYGFEYNFPIYGNMEITKTIRLAFAKLINTKSLTSEKNASTKMMNSVVNDISICKSFLSAKINQKTITEVNDIIRENEEKAVSR